MIITLSFLKAFILTSEESYFFNSRNLTEFPIFLSRAEEFYLRLYRVIKQEPPWVVTWQSLELRVLTPLKQLEYHVAKACCTPPCTV